VKNSHKDSYYIYNRKVCSKKQKTAEIRMKYGAVPPKSENSVRQSPIGREFARQQLRRAQLAEMQKRAQADFEKRNGRMRGERNGSAGFSGRPFGAGVAAAAVEERQNPMREYLNRAVLAFESLKDRISSDQELARRRASFSKKWSRYRHVFLTVLAIVAILALFVMATYKLIFVVRSIDVRSSGVYDSSEGVKASCIEEGALLYSFSTSDAEADITFRCPYIKSAEIRRTIPDKVEVVVSEDEAAYVINVWGDWAVVSRNLRVLEVSDKFPENDKLILLSIPQVKYSVAGRAMEFYDTKDERYVREVLKALETSSLSEESEIRALYTSDRYNITMSYGGLYTIEFGDDADMYRKFEMCSAALNSGKLTAGVPARIVIEDPETASIRYDLNTMMNQK
jgi:cell division septal protein FtsQ